MAGTRCGISYGSHMCENRVKSTVLMPRMPAAKGIREEGIVIPKFSNRWGSEDGDDMAQVFSRTVHSDMLDSKFSERQQAVTQLRSRQR
jgi:hypothetical protein